MAIAIGSREASWVRYMVNNNNNRIRTKPAGVDAIFVVLVSYFGFEYIRPQESLFPFLSVLKIPMLLTLTLFICFLKSDKSILKDKLVILTGLFIFEIGFSIVYALNSFSVWNVFFSMIIIMLAVILVMPTICNTRKKLYSFFKLWIVIHAVVALYSVFHAGHGPGGFLLDENDFALALNMVLPISIYLSMSSTISGSKRLYYQLISLFFIICIGLTNSRGGFLGLIAVFGLIWLFSDNRVKNLFKVLGISLILAFPVYKMIPQSYINEMSSIADTEDDTRLERIYSWTKGWEMFVDNPILGIGANNYPWNIFQYQMKDPEFDPQTMISLGGAPAHSMYFTLIPELGIIGIIIFSLILYQIFKKLNEIVSYSKGDNSREDDLLLAKALIVSTVTFLVTGTFISVLYYPPFWYIVGFTLTMHSVFLPKESVPKQVLK